MADSRQRRHKHTIHISLLPLPLKISHSSISAFFSHLLFPPQRSETTGCCRKGQKRPRPQKTRLPLLTDALAHVEALSAAEIASLSTHWFCPRPLVAGRRFSLQPCRDHRDLGDGVIRLNCWHKALRQMAPFDLGPNVPFGKELDVAAIHENFIKWKTGENHFQ